MIDVNHPLLENALWDIGTVIKEPIQLIETSIGYRITIGEHDVGMYHKPRNYIGEYIFLYNSDETKRRFGTIVTGVLRIYRFKLFQDGCSGMMSYHD